MIMNIFQYLSHTCGSTNSYIDGARSPAKLLPPAGVLEGDVATSLWPLPLSLDPCKY